MEFRRPGPGHAGSVKSPALVCISITGPADIGLPAVLNMTSTQSYRYRVVDVFTDTPLKGNPLAVFPDARGLDDDTMQDIARELNLSETTFVLPATRPDC